MKLRFPPKQTAKPKAEPKQKPVAGVDVGDHVYVKHAHRGPIAVRVLAHGVDGLTGVCDQKQRHQVKWDAVLGHKKRMLQRYRLVEQGADGALIEDDQGNRRYIAGEVPVMDEAVQPPKAEDPTIATSPTSKDDPLLGRQDRLRKALELPPGAMVIFAKAEIANRPGLRLEDKTDRTGKHTRRWVRTMKDQPKDREKPAPEEAKPAHGAPMQHGDTVAFRHGDVGGEGKIVASGRDGVTLEGKDGQQHQVRHEHIVHPGDKGPTEDAAGGGSSGGSGGDGEGEGPTPPDKFSATDYAAQHNDLSVTPEQILKSFPPDTADKIAEVDAKLKTVEQTIDTFRKDGKWTPERAKLHAKIIEGFLSQDKISAATPAERAKPSFTILGGRGGSGKSWFKNRVYDPARCIVLDADEIKHQLPEYKGWNAAQVHEESGELFDAITGLAMELGLNIVHDATMKTSKKAVALVQRFKDAGYRTEAHYMYLPPQEAAKRAVARFLGETKRFVPPGIVLNNVTNEGSFDQVKGMVDAWSFRDNNVGKGEQPKLLSEKTDEADTGKSGLRGLPAGRDGDDDQGAGVAGEDGPGKAQGAGSLSKAATTGGSGRIIFLKAVIPGGASGDLLAGDVGVKGHVRGHTYVAPYHQTRNVKPAAPPEPAAAPSKAPLHDGLSEASKAAMRKMKDLIRRGTGLRELYFHPKTVEVLLRDGFSFRPGVSLSWLMTAPTTANQYQAKFTQGTFCQNYFKANSYHNDINQVQVGGNFCFKFGERSNLKLAYEGAFGEGNSTQEGIISFFYEF